jgi:twitching motility protein PilT
MQLTAVLEEAVRRNASDVLLSAGAPITYHVYGRLEQDACDHPLTPTESAALAHELLTDEQSAQFDREWDLDLGFELPDVARFRASVFRQRGSVAMALRLIPLEIPHYSKIGIPLHLLTRLVNLPQGLILVTGPTGSGKSTTIASIIEYLNTEHQVPRHIVTIEDPIEFLFRSQTCVIDQREVGSDTKNYAIGLRSALRQMPHIIFVGEMRDRETMETALTAAETGNVVISTLSTQSAAKTINRVIDVFPLDDQSEVRARLALSLKAVLSQILLPRCDTPGRVAAREVLFVSGSIANLIREGKIHQIDNVIASSSGDGMVLLDDSLMALHSEGVVQAADLIPRLQDADRVPTLVQS